MTARPVLVIAPHPDDEVLGCGGTIARLTDQGIPVTVLVVSANLPPLYPADVRGRVHQEALAAHAVLGVTDSEFLDFPSVELSRMSVAELTGGVQRVVDRLEPATVFIPFPDRHVDHRAVFDAGMVATRPVGAGTGIAMVAMYETISETFWNAPGAEPTFSPNWVVDITETVGAKTAAFAEYDSQVQEYPSARTTQALEALALFRGSQAGMEYGEAFQIVRMLTGEQLPWQA